MFKNISNNAILALLFNESSTYEDLEKNMKLRQVLVTVLVSLFIGQALAELPLPTRFNLTEVEVMELNLAREIVMTDRFELNVSAESEQADFFQVMTERLNELGWTVSWQGEGNLLDNTIVSDFYRLGGQHLRLELSETSPNNYNMLMYRF